jgi:hypothetical protein
MEQEKFKLLIESVDKDSIEYLVEGKTEAEKTYRIKGAFMEAERKNRNGRIYPKSVLEKEVSRYCKEEIAQGLSMGSADHPQNPVVCLKDASYIVESLDWSGNIVNGSARVLSTPSGQILKCLMNDRVSFGVSSRSLGSLNNGYVSENLKLLAVDAVANASSYSSTVVESIVENYDFIIQGNKFVAVAVEKFEKDLAKHGTKSLYEDLSKFLESLKQKI